MRPEVAAAWGMGVALPVLEVMRRRTNFVTISGYVDDFIAGGLLLFAAWSATRAKRGGPVLLVAAWGVLCGGMYASFFRQLASASDVSGLPNELVVLVKGVIFAIGIGGLWLSIRSAVPRERAD